MTTTPPSPETTAADPHAAREAFMAKAVNSKDFMEFVAKHADAETFDINDYDAVSERMETFEKLKAVKEVMAASFGANMRKDLGFELDGAMKADVADHYDRIAIENPAHIAGLHAKIESYQTTRHSIEVVEAEVAKLGNREDLARTLGEERAKKVNLETALPHMTFAGSALFKMDRFLSRLDRLVSPIMGSEYARRTFIRRTELDDIQRSVDAVRETHGTRNEKGGYDIGLGEAAQVLNVVNAKIEVLEKTIRGIDDLNAQRAMVGETADRLRKEALGSMQGIAGLTEKIKIKVRDQMTKIVQPGTLESYDAAQKRLDELRSAAAATEMGVNPLGGLDEEAYQKDLDENLTTIISEKVMETLLAAEFGENPLTALEKAMAPYLERTKLGSKEGDEAREFIRAAITEAAQNLPDDVEGKAKRLLVSRILYKARR